MIRRYIISLSLALGMVIMLSGAALPVSFDIRPIRIFFDADTRTERLTVENMGEDDFSLQIKVYRWSQDEKGEDAYDGAADIVIFPKMLKVKKGEERIIRVGTNLKPGQIEKTYRIYLEEIPSLENLPEGATVRILTRTGIPLFVRPVNALASGGIESLSMRGGDVRFSVKNDGNLHFIITSIVIRGVDAGGKESFLKELGGWYLLGGASRLYTTPVPAEACAETARINVEIKTDRLNLSGNLDVDRSMCPH